VARASMPAVKPAFLRPQAHLAGWMLALVSVCGCFPRYLARRSALSGLVSSPDLSARDPWRALPAPHLAWFQRVAGGNRDCPNCATLLTSLPAERAYGKEKAVGKITQFRLSRFPSVPVSLPGFPILVSQLGPTLAKRVYQDLNQCDKRSHNPELPRSAASKNGLILAIKVGSSSM